MLFKLKIVIIHNTMSVLTTVHLIRFQLDYGVSPETSGTESESIIMTEEITVYRKQMKNTITSLLS